MDHVNCVSEATYEEWTRRAKPKEGDLILAREAPIGNVAIIPKNLQVCLGQRTVLIRPDQDKVNPHFLLYLLLGNEIQSKFQALSGGATVAHLNMGEIRDLELPRLPNRIIQEKIAAILSPYDDLIENNTRRIKILEEMAQLIYREWFVNFRLPGSQKVMMVNSPLGKMPEGWEVAKLSEITEVIDCLHSKKPKEADDGDQFGILLHIWNIPGGGQLDLSKKFYINRSDYEMWTKRIEVHEGDCVITNVGRIGDFAQIPKGVKAAIGRNMTAVRPIPGRITPTYLVEYLRSPYMDKERIAKKDSGTIMDSLNVKGIVQLLVPVPNNELMNDFEKMSRPVRLRLEILCQQNDILRQTRDLLLPKLISGKLDVSDLDIDTGAADD